jgi:hypothetical protein
VSTPADAHALAVQLYQECSPALGTHVRCRAHSLLALGCARAMGLDATLVHVPEQHHYIVRFATGEVSEDWWGDARLVPPR